MSSAYTRRTPRTRTCCAGRANCPRCPRAGASIFASAFGSPTSDVGRLALRRIAAVDRDGGAGDEVGGGGGEEHGDAGEVGGLAPAARRATPPHALLQPAELAARPPRPPRVR